MVGEGGTPLSRLEAAVREFQARQDRRVDPKGLRSVIDALEGEFATEVRDAQKSGDHLVGGSVTAASWISRTCGMSVSSAADRLCVGEQLQSLPKVAAALSSGEISYQSTSLLCHLREQLGDKRDRFDEDEMLGFARQFSVFHLRMLCRTARHVADPDGFFNDAEHDYTRRRLHISLMSDGMHAIEGVLDPECGAAVKTALDALAKPRGPEDERTRPQRMADAMGEVVHHAMDEGKLPRRNGVRPHVTVTATLEGLKNEFGAPPADLELSLPISTRTLERIACDSTISPGAARRLDGHRRRPSDTSRIGTGAPCTPHARSRVPVPRLRSPRELDPGSSHRLVDEGRQDRRPAHGPSLPLPPPAGPRRRVASREERRRASLHPT